MQFKIHSERPCGAIKSNKIVMKIAERYCGTKKNTIKFASKFLQSGLARQTNPNKK